MCDLPFYLLVTVRTFHAGKLCRKHKVFFHTDAAQAVGKIPIDVNAMNIDLLSISGHKIYGPKGLSQVLFTKVFYMYQEVCIFDHLIFRTFVSLVVIVVL